jgi:hypothetical protein
VEGSKVGTILNATSHIVYPLPSVYAINRAWLGIYFVSFGVMFLAAIFSIVTRFMRHAPTLLGYVSSLIRGSSYFEDTYKNNLEDGAHKTKRLGSMRVMVADVRNRGERAGGIAFAPADIGQRVEKGRWYD